MLETNTKKNYKYDLTFIAIMVVISVFISTCFYYIQKSHFEKTKNKNSLFINNIK